MPQRGRWALGPTWCKDNRAAYGDTGPLRSCRPDAFLNGDPGSGSELKMPWESPTENPGSWSEFMDRIAIFRVSAMKVVALGAELSEVTRGPEKLPEKLPSFMPN